jgi:hypothetical protein
MSVLNWHIACFNPGHATGLGLTANGFDLRGLHPIAATGSQSDVALFVFPHKDRI